MGYTLNFVFTYLCCKCVNFETINKDLFPVTKIEGEAFSVITTL